MDWTGSIALDDQHRIESVHIQNVDIEKHTIPNGVTLRFLSVVETCRIPLYLALGSPCSVSSSDVETERWFSHILLNNANDQLSSGRPDWWRVAAADSRLGILVSVEHHDPSLNLAELRTTEILFYGSHTSSQGSATPTLPGLSPFPGDVTDKLDHRPSLEVKALALSSDLLQHFQPCEPTPPASPVKQAYPAVFLHPLQSTNDEIVNEPPVRKRRTANDAFDAANERRQKARRKGGEGVVAAATSNSDRQIPSLQHRRSTSTSQVVPLQTRPFSRSPSVASSRPPTANRPSTLYKVESGATLSEQSTTGWRNKDYISRIVMTGMRLYGLEQRKKRSTRGSSSMASPAVDADLDETESDRKNDEEYKIIYHQVSKGTCLAFRATIDHESLQRYSGQVRDVVDQLLLIFCTNPLADGLGKSDEKLTPGGRAAFGGVRMNEKRSPFQAVA